MVEKIFGTFVQIFWAWAEHGNFEFFTAKLLYLALNQIHNSLILLFCIAQPDLSDAWFFVLYYLQKQHSLLRFLPFLYSVNQFAHFALSPRFYMILLSYDTYCKVRIYAIWVRFL